MTKLLYKEIYRDSVNTYYKLRYERLLQKYKLLEKLNPFDRLIIIKKI